VDDKIENEIDVRLRRIAAARNLANCPSDTLAILAKLITLHIEQFIADEVAAIEKLFPQPELQPINTTDKLLQFLAMAKVLGECASNE